jgi:hypothetical protein
MQHFLLVYDRRLCKLVLFREYPEDAEAAAYDERHRLELEHRLDPEMEIIVISAPSRAVLESTHSRYFKTVGELLRDGEKLTYKR